MASRKNSSQLAVGSWQLAISDFLKKAFLFCLLLTAICQLQSCGPYSFTGTKLSPDLKTITINNFVMNTAGGPANLSLNLTERLKEYYQRNTNLKLKPGGDADLILEGAIVGYELSPVAPTAADQAALNRLTITVQARFVNNKDETQNFDQTFSFFRDFAQSQTLTQVEGSLVPQILDQLVLDMFNRSAGDW
jgi:hypothetical protein